MRAIDEREVTRIQEASRNSQMLTSGQVLEDADPAELYQAVARAVRDEIMGRWAQARKERIEQGDKRVYYLSVEYLLGRALINNLMNLGLYEAYRRACEGLGLDLNAIEEMEAEPGLGNGGLGRLAACFLDSLATERLPAMGCGIRYEYGLFRQRIVDGGQREEPDDWLRLGNAWEIPRPEQAVEVRFGGRVEENWGADGKLRIDHREYRSVLAVPYDMPVVGYGAGATATLRLWSAQAPEGINMPHFAQGDYVKAAEERELAEVISKVLYPEDNHPAGKMLRLKQHYFFVSATMQYIVKTFKRRNPGVPLDRLPEQAAVHINDTHPSLAIPELMRILMDEEGIDWEGAWNIARATFSYTNHTIMAEALEKWPEEMFRTLLPRIHSIVKAIDGRFRQQLAAFYPGRGDLVNRGAILESGQVRMANLCIALSHAVNGVSQLHAQILRQDVFRVFADMEPEKFFGITNGVTPRRWLHQANPGLAGLITDTIGEGWVRDAGELGRLNRYVEDPGFRARFAGVKRANKERFARWLGERQGVRLDPEAIFDVQAKRLHEYKRQLLNVLHILSLYVRIRDDAGFRPQPRAFLFGAKAYPGYEMAKRVIRLITATGRLVEGDPAARACIQVAFVENYGVTAAQLLIPAADISEQLSTAGKEASGTGNMKFMLNGAVTVGTLDGANVEIADAVGRDNIFIFGHDAAQARELERAGYDSLGLYRADPLLRRVLDMLRDGSLGEDFSPIFDALVTANNGRADAYLNLKDFAAYAAAQREAEAAYRDPDRWWAMAARNTANAGAFSSDRAIREYNARIWHLAPIEP